MARGVTAQNYRGALIWGAAMLLAALLAWQLQNVLFLILWGSFLAYLVAPLASRLEALGLSRVQASVTVFLGLGAGIALCLYLGVPIFIREGANLLRLLPPHVAELLAKVSSVGAHLFRMLPPRLAAEAERTLNQYERGAVTSLVAALRHLWTAIPGLISLFLGPLVAFYLVKDRGRILAAFLSLWPPEDEILVRDLLWRIDRSVGGFLRGQLLVALAVGALAALVAVVFHLGFGLFIGVVAGVTEVIPYVGPIVGALPAVAIASLYGPSRALWVILAFIAIHQIEGGILSPLIVGQEMGLSPLAVLLALFVGGEVGGVVGLLLAVPATGMLGTLGRWLFDRWAEPLFGR
jgi:predicted PurR-regulated permease PerM